MSAAAAERYSALVTERKSASVTAKKYSLSYSS